jgi:hypothetical protein
MVSTSTASLRPPEEFQKKHSRAVKNGTIVAEGTVGSVKCDVCMEFVIPVPSQRVVMRHQDSSIRGFEITVNQINCPFCGEVGMRASAL